MAVLHGGQLSRVAKQYQIPASQWLDLSTGIAPFSYPIPVIAQQIWQDLPTIPESLIKVAKQYYQASHCWPLAGSQQLIEKLPLLWQDKCQQLEQKHVYLPKVGYKEHQHAWQKAGYQLHFYQQTLPTDIERHSVVVVINPNNPLNDSFSIAALSALQCHCQAQQGLLVIDEAFADIFPPEFSFVPQLTTMTEDVIVLRSFGKFFGLAGVRIGFVCSSQQWCTIIQDCNGPWSINGPALVIAEHALQDTRWQHAQRTRLQQQSVYQTALLKAIFPSARIESNALFITLFVSNAPQVYEKLCQQGVYVRLTDEQTALRFGIADKQQLIILQKALTGFVCKYQSQKEDGGPR